MGSQCIVYIPMRKLVHVDGNTANGRQWDDGRDPIHVVAFVVREPMERVYKNAGVCPFTVCISMRASVQDRHTAVRAALRLCYPTGSDCTVSIP